MGCCECVPLLFHSKLILHEAKKYIYIYILKGPIHISSCHKPPNYGSSLDSKDCLNGGQLKRTPVSKMKKIFDSIFFVSARKTRNQTLEALKKSWVILVSWTSQITVLQIYKNRIKNYNRSLDYSPIRTIFFYH